MSFMARAQPYRRWYRLDNRFLTVAASLVGRHLDCAHHAGIAGRDVLHARYSMASQNGWNNSKAG